MVVGCGDMVTYNNDARQRGIQLYKAANYTDAAGAFNNAIRQDPRDYHSDYYLGLTYEAMGNYRLAAQSYRTALGVMKNSILEKPIQCFG